MEKNGGTLAGIAVMAISPMERCRFIVAGGDPAKEKFNMSSATSMAAQDEKSTVWTIFR